MGRGRARRAQQGALAARVVLDRVAVPARAAERGGHDRPHARVPRGQARLRLGGYADDEPLARDLFYWTPFLTCSKCNTLLSIDVPNARKMHAAESLALRAAKSAMAAGSTNAAEAFDAQKREVDALKATGSMEVLPKCPGCNSTQDYQLGAHDLSALIAGSKAELRRLMRLKKKSARVIQSAYRYYLRRQFGRATRHRREVEAMLLHRSARAAQSLVRGRLGRRKAVCVKALRVIERAHPMLVARALRARDEDEMGRDDRGRQNAPKNSAGLTKGKSRNPTAKQRRREKGGKKVFWYKTKEQLDMLYSDYLVLVERTGYQPPRFVVEENIKEIARRIVARMHVLTTRVQARWRAITVRFLLITYVMEKIRVREIEYAAVFRIARVFRAWVARKGIARMKLEDAQGAIKASYAGWRKLRAEGEAARGDAAHADERYKRERAEERAARFTGTVHPGLAGGNKMTAFRESAYGTDAVTDLMDEQYKTAVASRVRERDERRRSDQRGEWVREQQMADPAMQQYFREEMRQRSVSIMKRLTTERPVRDVTAMMREHNRKGLRYPYPSDINEDPLAPLYEGLNAKAGGLYVARLDAARHGRERDVAPRHGGQRRAGHAGRGGDAGRDPRAQVALRLGRHGVGAQEDRASGRGGGEEEGGRVAGSRSSTSRSRPKAEVALYRVLYLRHGRARMQRPHKPAPVAHAADCGSRADALPVVLVVVRAVVRGRRAAAAAALRRRRRPPRRRRPRSRARARPRCPRRRAGAAGSRPRRARRS